LKNRSLLVFFLITIVFFLFEPACAESAESPESPESEEYFTFEVGSIIGCKLNTLHETKFDPLSVLELGYMRKRENKFIHIFWGSLSDVHDVRTSFIFGEIGWTKQLKNPEYYLDFSFGIGRVDLTSDYLSTNNMFTESISIGNDRYYLSLRHMSNGKEYLDNDSRNLGRNMLTFGIRF